MRATLVCLMLLPLMACDRRSEGGRAAGDAARGTGSVLVDTDNFKAAVSVPGLGLGGRALDIDGMKLYPGSTVHGVRVDASDNNGAERATVVIDFNSPAAPGEVAAALIAQAKGAGFALVRGDGQPITLDGSKDDGGKPSHVHIVLHGDGAVTRGTATVTSAKG